MACDDFIVSSVRRPSTAKFRQPPPVIDVSLGFRSSVALSIEEAQSLRRQLDDALADAEKERIRTAIK